MRKANLTMCIIVVLLVLLSVPTYAGTLEEYVPEYLDKGDMTGDDKYSLRDALSVLLISAKVNEATSEEAYRADVNSDEAVTVADAEMLFEAALYGKYTNFGYEKPDVDVSVIIVDSKSYTVGDYCYNKLSDALEYAKANAPTCEEERLTLLFAPGVYRERVTISTNYLTFKNMAPEKGDANITWYYGMASYGVNGPNSQYNGAICYYSTGQRGADGRATLITAHDFIAEDMMFENSFNIYVCDEEREDYCPYPINSVTVEQREKDLYSKRLQEKGIAVWLSGADRTIFKNCKIMGRQDTMFLSGRTYFENCYIEGTVDFLCAGGTSIFEGCTLNVPYNQGRSCVTSNVGGGYGYLFMNCSFTKEVKNGQEEASDSSCHLGRPSGKGAMVTFWNCKMDTHIGVGEERFGGMETAGTTAADGRYSEGNTMDINGNLLDLSEICPEYENIITEEDMKTTQAPILWLYGNDGWNPGNYPEVEQ